MIPTPPRSSATGPERGAASLPGTADPARGPWQAVAVPTPPGGGFLPPVPAADPGDPVIDLWPGSSIKLKYSYLRPTGTWRTPWQGGQRA
ncbi:hypothetical protein IBTHAUMO2_550002 [Nitrosopumilaceae archaeon]|nr:hypothetical protein IBTHAUMO2_550002 [Nitrosopumilaceae archaeon]